jgi:hypothetical protein
VKISRKSDRVLWCLTSLSAIFHLHCGVQFNWWRKTQTCSNYSKKKTSGEYFENEFYMKYIRKYHSVEILLTSGCVTLNTIKLYPIFLIFSPLKAELRRVYFTIYFYFFHLLFTSIYDLSTNVNSRLNNFIIW